MKWLPLVLVIFAAIVVLGVLYLSALSQQPIAKPLGEEELPPGTPEGAVPATGVGERPPNPPEL